MIHVDAGCDPNGWCWPAFDLARPVIERQVENPESIYPFHREGGVYAFSLIDSGPVCQIWLPLEDFPDGWTVEVLRAHELAHCAGFSHPYK